MLIETATTNYIIMFRCGGTGSVEGHTRGTHAASARAVVASVAHHAVPLILNGADEVREVVQAAADDTLVLRHGGTDARELKLLHTRRQRQLRRTQTCHTYNIIIYV